jgi:diguanylate cyclase (GGDEF)-like protein
MKSTLMKNNLMNDCIKDDAIMAHTLPEHHLLKESNVLPMPQAESSSLSSDAAWKQRYDTLTVALVQELGNWLAEHKPLAVLARYALGRIATALGAETGTLVRQQGNSFSTLAEWSSGIKKEVLEDATLIAAFRACQASGKAVVLPNANEFVTVVHPVGFANPPRILLVLNLREAQGSSGNCHSETEQPLEQLCQVLGTLLDASLAQERLKLFLSLQHEMLSLELATLYGRILELAVNTVPGAEYGSLAVREGEVFKFKAMVGFDVAAFQTVALSWQETEVWCNVQPGELPTEPRLLVNEDVQAYSTASAETSLIQFQEHGKLEEIRANLCLPITYQGELLAVLNLDNVHGSQAFAADSLQSAKLFGPVVAAALHEKHHREALERAALSDALTGLGNRRAFDQDLTIMIDKAKRYNESFTVFVMDLKEFKVINDTYGHAAGDAALVSVATTLRNICRASDGLYRWGGDEFAALLPHTNTKQAQVFKKRLMTSIAELEVKNFSHHLAINVGLATYGQDGLDDLSLVKLADKRMYDEKVL